MVQKFTGVKGRDNHHGIGNDMAFQLLLTDTLLYRMSKIFSSSPEKGQGSMNIIF